MKTEIQTIAVIGADLTGRGIVLACLRAGYATILEDVSRSRLEDAVAWLEENAAATKLRTTSVIEDAVRDADLIIEAAADELEVKLELFTLFDKFAKPGAILASTSSSLCIADIASVTFCAERCIGLRFPETLSSRPSGCALAQPEAEGPAFRAQRKVIEVVVAPETSAETVAACREVARRMGREVVVVADGEAASALGRSATN